MREIEFRGQREDTGEWVYGCGYMIDNATVGYPVYVYSDARFKHYKVHPETVGQYTGLKDRNGVKIFDGDIVCYFSRCFSVKYSSGCFYAGLNSLNSMIGNTGVIGNIHDNPELLEEK
jgi:uncharacterized phage protein (TIGR01671 family)